MTKLGFIGAGKVGTALAISLSNKGYPVVAVYDLNPEAADYFAQEVSGCKIANKTQDVANAADLVFITTVDDQINQIASDLKWRAGQMAVHCSGANSTALLEPAKEQGALVGVFHPGNSFADKKQAIQNIAGNTFDIEAEEPLLSTIKELVAALDGYWIEVKASDRPVYHVAIEMPSLFTMLLARTAVKMFAAMDIEEEKALNLVTSLMRVALRIMETLGTSTALTGPVDRGDTETVKKHIDGLRRVCPSVLPLYRELARQNIPFAIEHRSIDQKKADELKAILEQY